MMYGAEQEPNWSTGAVSLLTGATMLREDDADAWTTRISQTFVPLHARPIGAGPFFGALRTLQRGSLLIARIDGSAQEVRHGRCEVAAQRDAAVYLNLQLDGIGQVRAGQVETRTTPNAGAVVPSDETFTLRFERPFSQLCVAMPADWFADRLGFPATSLQQRHVNTDRGVGRIVRAAIGAVIEAENEDEALLCGDLLGRALAEATRLAPPGRADVRPDTLLVAVRTLIGRRLAEADLTPAKAAAALGCSLSTLHLHCQRGGRSFAAMLREARLDAAATLLRSGEPGVVRIEAVGFACGFADPSHFARRFRGRFGITPSLYQAEAAARRS